MKAAFDVFFFPFFDGIGEAASSIGQWRRRRQGEEVEAVEELLRRPRLAMAGLEGRRRRRPPRSASSDASDDASSAAADPFTAAVATVARAPAKDFMAVRQEWAAIRVQTAFRGFLVKPHLAGDLVGALLPSGI